MNSPVTQNPAPKTARKKRVLRTQSQWQALVTEFETSRLSQRAFCDKHQIGLSGLYKWRNYFSAQNDSADFIDIGAPLNATAASMSPAEQPPAAWLIELELGHGMRLRLQRA